MPARLRFEHGRAHNCRKLLLLHFGLQAHHWRWTATSWTWEVIPTRLLPNKFFAGRRYRVESMLLNTSWRHIYSRADLSSFAVAARARRFSHFLHFSQVTEPLRCGIEAIVGIVLHEIDRVLVHEGLTIDTATGHDLIS